MPVMMYKGIPYGEGTNTLDGLKDVDISNPSDGDVLKYDSSIGKFVNADESDPGIPTPTASDIDKVIKVESDGQGGAQYTLGVGGSAETEISGTLAAGASTVTLQNAAITTNSKIDYYAEVFGVHPINAVVTTGQIVLTYRPRATAVNIKVVVS